ncbi:MAG: CPBP family intramembrane metalloprotease [Rubrobacter sp.]|nr:CPBP family intramembrane metalloprotease [Rubrobacter sp.]MDQ3638158.1 CPBP family intramembrane metalloprotease [Actinomycetota bacterium]
MDLLLNAILLFFVTAIVGGLALLAQWGRKNRSAEISLIVILLAISVLMVMLVAGLGAVVLLASNLELAPGAPDAPAGPLLTASVLVAVLAGLVGIALCIPPLRRVTSRRRVGGGEPVDQEATPWEPAETGDRAVGGRWADPPVFFGLWMFVMVLSYNLFNLLSFSELVESGVFQSADPISPSVVVVSELPFVIVALCGVGLMVRRNFREALLRLGYGPLTLPQLGIVPLFVAAALALEAGFNVLFSWLQPELFESVGEISEGLFNADSLSLPAAILFGLLIGIGAAAGEETLFRGAVQPALGITLTSILFASIHVQYGPSIVLVHIFVLSVGFGLLRKYVNTTASFLAHAGYNFTLVILSYFLSV